MYSTRSFDWIFARSIRSACIDIAVKILHRSCWLRTPRGTCQSMIERLSMSKASAMVAISWADGAFTALTRQWLPTPRS